MASKTEIDILFKMHADLQDLKRLQTEVKNTKQQLDGVSKMLKGGALKLAGAMGLSMSIGAIVGTTKAMADMGAQLRDNAKAAGTSAEFLQVWRYAAEQNSVSAETATKGIQTFTRGLGEAQKGVGPLAKEFDRYNIAVKNANGTNRSMEEVLADVADRTKGMNSETERAAFVAKLFGNENINLVNVLGEGSGALETFRQGMIRNNQLMSEDTVQTLGAISDSITELSTHYKTFWATQIAGAAKFLGLVKDNAGWTKEYYQELAKEQLRAEGVITARTNLRARETLIAQRAAKLENDFLVAWNERNARAQAAAAAAAQEAERAAIAAQDAAAAEAARQAASVALARAEAARQQADQRYNWAKLSDEEKMQALLLRREELLARMATTELGVSDADRSQMLKEYASTLNEIVGLQLRLDGGRPKDQPGGDNVQIAKGFDIGLMTLESLDRAAMNFGNTFLNSIREGTGLMGALGAVGNQVFSELVGGVISYATNWMLTQALIQTGLLKTDTISETLRAKRMATTAAEGAAATASMAPAAAAASISSFGAAAALGVAALLVAMAAFGGFQAGGHTGYGRDDQPAGIVHKNEVVVPAPVVRAIGLSNLLRMIDEPAAFDINSIAPALPELSAPNFKPSMPLPSFAGSGSVSGRDGERRVSIHTHLDRRSMLSAMRDDVRAVAMDVYNTGEHSYRL